MTSMNDLQAANAASDDRTRMPRAVQFSLLGGLAALSAGGVYLVSVRGEALLVDLAAFGQRMWCF